MATAEVGDGERKDLERGLGALGSGEKGGGGAATGGEGMDCVPVWLDDKIHDSEYSEALDDGLELIKWSRLLQRNVQDVPLAYPSLPPSPRFARQGDRGTQLERLRRSQLDVRKESC